VGSSFSQTKKVFYLFSHLPGKFQECVSLKPKRNKWTFFFFFFKEDFMAFHSFPYQLPKAISYIKDGMEAISLTYCWFSASIFLHPIHPLSCWHPHMLRSGPAQSHGAPDSLPTKAASLASLQSPGPLATFLTLYFVPCLLSCTSAIFTFLVGHFHQTLNWFGLEVWLKW
jgi:hypothetical protein